MFYESKTSGDGNWVILIILLVIVLIISGIGDMSGRFHVVEYDLWGGAIYADTETGVLYTGRSGKGSSMSPMLKPDGSPMMYVDSYGPMPDDWPAKEVE